VVALILGIERHGATSDISVSMLCCEQICVGRRAPRIGAQAAGSRFWA